jgi:hypothetical protein
MDFASFTQISPLDMERELLQSWSKQLEKYSFDDFIRFLKDKSFYVELLLHYGQKMKVLPRTKYASVYFMFSYLQEKKNSQKYVVTQGTTLIPESDSMKINYY